MASYEISDRPFDIFVTSKTEVTSFASHVQRLFEKASQVNLTGYGKDIGKTVDIANLVMKLDPRIKSKVAIGIQAASPYYVSGYPENVSRIIIEFSPPNP